MSNDKASMGQDKANATHDDQEAFEAGRMAFRSIAAGLSDHYIYGKSMPREPSCPYRIVAKREAWKRGYDSERDEFLADFFDRDD